MSQRKIDDFIGTDSEYIVYLERKVRHLIAHPGSLSPPPSFDGNNDFDIIEYDPVSSTQDASKSLRPAKRQRTQDKGRWEGEMDAMLRDINDEDLALKRKSVGLSSSPDILMALDLIIDGKRPPTERVANDTHLSVVCYDPSNIVVQLLDSFATRTAALEIDATFTTQIYHFRMLVFISLCCVALKRGVAMSVIENIMQKCVSDSTGKNLSRLRSGALWVNRMMSTLAADGFGHLAYEIFVLCELEESISLTNGRKF
jgi:hypothetical protein